jgi:SAM-dependent methyltransferase
MSAADRSPWNHNIAYHPVVLAAVPSPCGRALDVGCGTGLLLCELSGRCREVVGIDLDAVALAAAAGRLGAVDNVKLLQADVLTADLPQAGFDLVAAVASLHHLPLRTGLTRLAALVRPGGRLVVVGLYRGSTPMDYLTSAAAFPVARLLAWRRGRTPIGAPIREPTTTLRDIRVVAGRLTPGARIRRRLLFRYTLIWTRPAHEAG